MLQIAQLVIHLRYKVASIKKQASACSVNGIQQLLFLASSDLQCLMEESKGGILIQLVFRSQNKPELVSSLNAQIPPPASFFFNILCII